MNIKTRPYLRDMDCGKIQSSYPCDLPIELVMVYNICSRKKSVSLTAQCYGNEMQKLPATHTNRELQIGINVTRRSY